MNPLALLLATVLGLLATPLLPAAFSLDTSPQFYTIDTEAGLVFKVRRTDTGASSQSPGDIASLVYKGVEYQDQSKGTHINSGFDWLYTGEDAVSVSAATVGSEFIKITVTAGNAGDLTHYYMVRKGYPHIYMATCFSREPDTQALVRFLARIQESKLSGGPEPPDIRNTDVTVESGDIFGFSSGPLAGQTRSKHYSNMRLKDWAHFGGTGDGVGLWIVRSNHEGDSGGPFYRSLLQQITGTTNEITYIINYGQAQTEPYRLNILNGPYTMVFNDGSAPDAPDTSWLPVMGLKGFVGNDGRGTVSATGITGRDAGSEYTVGFANADAQYWAEVSPLDGSFTSSGMLPGTYAMKIYREEYAVHANAGVTVSAGATTALGTIAINNDPNTTVPLWRIGTWDGTPREFLNGDKVTTMHPSDVRMAPWSPGIYTVGASDPATGFPAYQWKDINGNQVIRFNLTAAQASQAATLRAGITVAYSGGRPNITVNSWTSRYQGPSSQPSTRSLTTGSYRGNNTTYTFSIPAGALIPGTNTLTLHPISGSGLGGFLSAGYSTDAIDLYLGSARTLPIPGTPASLTARGTTGAINLAWTTASHAASYAIHRSTTSGGPYLPVAAGVNGTTFSDTTAMASTAYHYVVNAVNTSGTGFHSPEASASWISDNDGDLIPDDWETSYYPSPSTASPLDDTDEDGFNTWTEWKAGTNPTESTSMPGPATTLTSLTPVADTFIAHRPANGANSTNFGRSTDLDLHQQGDIFMSAYVRFDLSTLPAGSTIEDASLTLTKAATNTLEPGYPLVSTRHDSLTTGRFAAYGLLDVTGNTAQDWNEESLTHDSSGSELAGTQGIQFDPAGGRTVSFDGINELASGGAISISGSGADPLVSFLEERLRAATNPGLTTFILDFLPNDNRGFALDSRETISGTAPALAVTSTAAIPVPDPDEDRDQLDDAWEARHFGTLAKTGNDDTDGDGTPEWLEQALGTDPNNATESFRLSIAMNDSGGLQLTWPNAEGVNFTVESSSTLSPPWTAEAAISGSSSPALLTYPVGNAPGPTFYRIGASRP